MFNRPYRIIAALIVVITLTYFILKFAMPGGEVIDSLAMAYRWQFIAAFIFILTGMVAMKVVQNRARLADMIRYGIITSCGWILMMSVIVVKDVLTAFATTCRGLFPTVE